MPEAGLRQVIWKENILLWLDSLIKPALDSDRGSEPALSLTGGNDSGEFASQAINHQTFGGEQPEDI